MKAAGVAGVLLAAGESRRFGGGCKLAAPFGGEALVLFAAGALGEAMREGFLAEVVAVVSSLGGEAAELLREKTAFAIVENVNYKMGISTSVNAGLAAVSQQCAAALFLPGDMPFVSAADIAAVVGVFQKNPAIAFVAAAHRGERGNPVLAARRQFAALRGLRGDAGARALFAENPPLLAECGAGVLRDMDTPADFAAAEAVGEAAQ